MTRCQPFHSISMTYEQKCQRLGGRRPVASVRREGLLAPLAFVRNFYLRQVPLFRIQSWNCTFQSRPRTSKVREVPILKFLVCVSVAFLWGGRDNHPQIVYA